MSNRTLPCKALGLLAAALVAVLPLRLVAGTTDISTVPLPTYSVGTTVDIKPNIMMVLDDSGSMDWNYLPDWANDTPPNYTSLPSFIFNNSQFNGVAYNPAITYYPPVSFTAAGAKDTSKYPSMTGAATTTGADSTTKPNWNNVPNDGYGVQSSSHTSLTNNAVYYVTVPGEYCDSVTLTNCTTSATPTGNFQYPAPLRWCNSGALTSCQANNDQSTYTSPRMPAPRTGWITVSSASSAVVTGITVNGAQIMSGPTTSSSTTTSVASGILTAINNCTSVISGNCTVTGYSAARSNMTVYIYAPAPTSATPVLSNTGSLSTTIVGFGLRKIPLPYWLTTGGTQSSAVVPGETYTVAITSTNNSYAYPGTSAKASTRTDCAGTTCTFLEEMTNYANWFAYYHTRMQMMKTATSRAFSVLDSDSDIAAGTTRYRVGYMTINNNTGTDFVNITDFTGTQKNVWFTKLFTAHPNNSTPLRQALSIAGRYYAGKYTGSNVNGVTATDPLQYSCQRNYTILSTDGFWNGNAGYKLDGSTAVGNQDAALPRPYNDGGSAQNQQQTSTLQTRTLVQTAQMGTLQKQTSQLQKSTSQLQKSTGQLQKRTITSQQRTLQVQSRTTQIQSDTKTLQTRTSSNFGSSWTGWTNTNSCTQHLSGKNQTDCQTLDTGWVSASSCTASGPTNGVTVTCQTADTGWLNASSCTGSGPTSGRTVTCQTADSGWVNSSSCTPGSANGQTVTCQTTDTGWANATSCTASNSGGVQVLCQVIPQTGPTNVSSCTAGTSSGIVTSCSYAAWTSFANSGTCTGLAQSAGPTNYTVGTAVQCQTIVASAFANAPSCSVTTPDSNGVSTQCQYSFAASAATSTCSPAYVANNYTNATVYTGCSTTNPAWVTASSCTAGSTFDSSGNKVQCQYTAWTGWTNVATCTAVAQSSSPNYTVGTARQCQTLTSGGTSDTLADVAAYYYATDLRSATATGTDATGTCTGPIISPSTTANDLCADNVPTAGRDTNSKQHMTTSTLGLGAQGAMVRSNYANNLAGQRVYQPDYWQQQSGDFYSVANGSTASQSSGVCTWINDGSTCTWSTPASDSLNNVDDLWHAAVNGRGTYFSATDPQSLADSLTAALSQIVNTPRPGTAAAAASSNPNITSSDNFVFSSSYKSVEWYGELIMQQLASDGSLGAQQWSSMRNLDCTSSAWQANFAYAAGAAFSQGGACYVVNTDYTSGSSFDGTASGTDGANISLMTGVTPGTRTIYVAGSGSSGLTTFTWANLSTTQQSYFNLAALTYVDAKTGLTQFCSIGAACLSSTSQTAAAGSNLVAFLAGDRSYEGSYYRTRKHVLGDIVSSEASYVKVPLQGYLDAGYSDFKAAQANRAATVYVGANDGMVHAFDGLTGKEDWAYIPSAVMPNLYHLADTDYANKHWYFVDGTPVVGDICSNSPSACSATQWKTILVGGLNDGGSAFYALDITDPTSPKLLWEFTNTNLGLSYSNPRITKLKDGTWVVIVASGYNNSDGVGRLFVLNANTGSLIRTISTGVGSATSPSGLTKIAARAPNSATDNTVFQVYGGDLLGNVWRFDVNNDIGTTGYDAQLLVSVQDPSGTAQPITSKPTVATVNNFPLVMVGTGQYLGIGDLSTTTTNTMYAIIDRLGSSTLPTPRSTNSNFVHQTMIDTSCPADAPANICSQGEIVRTVNATSVDWSVQNGWYVDFVLGGERSVTDPTLALGTLAFTTIKPQTSSSGTVTSCTGTDTAVAATSYLYYLNYLTGGAVDGTKNVVGNLLCTCVATRPSVVRTQTGSVEAIIRTSGGGTSSGTDMGNTSRQDLPYNPTGSSMRRLSWRDLNGQ